jgi:hypothetical protein
MRVLWIVPLAASLVADVAIAAHAQAAAPATVTVAVPRHTIIPVLVDKDIRVGGAGDQRQTKTIKLQVAQDVVVNGLLIAQKGDLAEGHLTTARNVTARYFSTDVSQEAALDIDDIVNYCGDTIHTEFERTYVGGVRGGFMSLGAHARRRFRKRPRAQSPVGSSREVRLRAKDI